MRLLYLLSVQCVCEAAGTLSAKWAQHLDGQVVVVVALKRDRMLCEGEQAIVEEETLRLSMLCGEVEYALSVLLQQPVEERIVTRRENAYMVVTLRKRVAALWWTSLAKHPEQFKTLIARDFTRGDAEPDPDEDGDVEQVRVGVDAHGKPVAKQTEEVCPKITLPCPTIL